jgi:hypothetical protein
LRIKLILGLVVGLLFCALATLEVPEFLNLTDDTSNDYSLVTVQENPVAAVQTQMPQLPLNPVVTVTHRKEPVVRFVSHNPAPTADDFLHSLCVLRT